MLLSIKELNHMFGMRHQILQFQSNTLTFIFSFAHILSSIIIFHMYMFTSRVNPELDRATCREITFFALNLSRSEAQFSTEMSVQLSS